MPADSPTPVHDALALASDGMATSRYDSAVAPIHAAVGRGAGWLIAVFLALFLVFPVATVVYVAFTEKAAAASPSSTSLISAHRAVHRARSGIRSTSRR